MAENKEILKLKKRIEELEEELKLKNRIKKLEEELNMQMETKRLAQDQLETFGCNTQKLLTDLRTSLNSIISKIENFEQYSNLSFEVSYLNSMDSLW